MIDFKSHVAMLLGVPGVPSDDDVFDALRELVVVDGLGSAWRQGFEARERGEDRKWPRVLRPETYVVKLKAQWLLGWDAYDTAAAHAVQSYLERTEEKRKATDLLDKQAVADAVACAAASESAAWEQVAELRLHLSDLSRALDGVGPVGWEGSWDGDSEACRVFAVVQERDEACHERDFFDGERIKVVDQLEAADKAADAAVRNLADCAAELGRMKRGMDEMISCLRPVQRYAVASSIQGDIKEAFKNVSYAFGLDAQGHVPTVERMLADGADWDAIGKAIGWDPATARDYWSRSLVARLSEENPDAMLLEPREMYDHCIVGLIEAGDVDDQWPREGDSGLIAVYDAELCKRAHMDASGCSHQEAAEHFDYNTAGSYVGPGTPTFRYKTDE